MSTHTPTTPATPVSRPRNDIDLFRELGRIPEPKPLTQAQLDRVNAHYAQPRTASTADRATRGTLGAFSVIPLGIIGMAAGGCLAGIHGLLTAAGATVVFGLARAAVGFSYDAPL